MAKTAIGRQDTWQLLDVIGSGDAGEVLRVQNQAGAQAVMKRPLQNASGGTILRQAMQIETEGQTLAKLAGIDQRRNNLWVHTPKLLDESPEGSSRTSKLFIVSEEVSGKAISGLLRDSLMGGPPLSQVLVVRVLAGMLQLLPQVHAQGVLWNDVKMDHIFWDETQKKLSFIDWGNSLSFDPQNPGSDQANPLLDYQQLLSEGRLLMEQTAPELLLELAWPLTAHGMTESEINALRFRVEYLEAYLGMRVVEYQVLLRKYLSRVENLATLRDTLELSEALEGLGVAVDHASILEAAGNLVLHLIILSDYAQARAATGLILERLPIQAGDNWKLSHYTLGLAALDGHNPAGALLEASITSDWSAAVWTLQEIHASPNFRHDLSPLLRAFRDASLKDQAHPETVEQLMAYTAAELGRWAQNPELGQHSDPGTLAELEARRQELLQILSAWGQISPGETLGNRAFELRTWANQGLGSAAPSLPALKLKLTQLLANIREIHRAWQEGDLQALQNKLKLCFLAEPSLAYLPLISNWVDQIETWFERFKAGPAEGQTLTQFAQNLSAEFPLGDNHLGVPAWLQGAWQAVHTIIAARDILTLQEQALAEAWPTPWLQLDSASLDLPLELASQTKLNHEQSAVAQEFHKALRTGMNTAAYLAKLARSLPAFQSLYRSLAESFSHSFDAIEHPILTLTPEAFPLAERAAIAEALSVLAQIQEWKQAQRQGRPAHPKPDNALLERWSVLQDLEKAGVSWQKETLPNLTAIRQRLWEQLPDPEAPPSKDPLSQCSAAVARLAFAWGKVADQGLYPAQVNEMLADADAAQEAFLRFWQEVEQNRGPILAWLAQANQPFLSGINHQLLSFSRQLRTVLRALDVVNTPQIARTRLARNSAADLIFALVQLDELLKPPSRKRSPIRDWQQQYLDLLKEDDRNAIQRKIQAIESIHPLLPWFDELVRRDADYFETRDSRQW